MSDTLLTRSYGIGVWGAEEHGEESGEPDPDPDLGDTCQLSPLDESCSNPQVHDESRWQRDAHLEITSRWRHGDECGMLDRGRE